MNYYQIHVYNSECRPGFTGVECIFKCSYPYYGDGCSKESDCPKELWDFAQGCRHISTEGKYLDNRCRRLSYAPTTKKTKTQQNTHKLPENVAR